MLTCCGPRPLQAAVTPAQNPIKNRAGISAIEEPGSQTAKLRPGLRATPTFSGAILDGGQNDKSARQHDDYSRRLPGDEPLPTGLTRRPCRIAKGSVEERGGVTSYRITCAGREAFVRSYGSAALRLAQQLVDRGAGEIWN